MRLRVLPVVVLSLVVSFELSSLAAQEIPDELHVVYRAKTGVFVSGSKEDPTGFDVELVKRFFAWHKSRKNRELSHRVDYVNTLNQLLKRVEAGGCDLAIGSVTATKERDKRVDFSNPYLPVRVVIFAPEGGFAGGDMKTELAGKTIGAIEGSTHIKMLKDLQSEVPNLTIKTDYPTAEDLFTALLEDSSAIDAAITDLTHYWVLNMTEKITLVGSVGEEQGLAFVFPEGSALVELVNEFLDFFTHSSVYFTLVRQYFGQEANEMIRMARTK
jgi:ABC-type amino acid transport substrate-binding protein